MKTSIAGQALRALAAIAVGAGVLYVEAFLAAALANQGFLDIPHGITLAQFEWRGLWHSVLLIWSLPSALGALLIACFKPRRWAFYSAWVVWPGFLLLIYKTAALVQYHQPVLLLTLYAVANLALIPLFLALYYALIRRHLTL